MGFLSNPNAASRPSALAAAQIAVARLNAALEDTEYAFTLLEGRDEAIGKQADMLLKDGAVVLIGPLEDDELIALVSETQSSDALILSTEASTQCALIGTSALSRRGYTLLPSPTVTTAPEVVRAVFDVPEACSLFGPILGDDRLGFELEAGLAREIVARTKEESTAMPLHLPASQSLENQQFSTYLVGPNVDCVLLDILPTQFDMFFANHDATSVNRPVWVTPRTLGVENNYLPTCTAQEIEQSGPRYVIGSHLPFRDARYDAFRATYVQDVGRELDGIGARAFDATMLAALASAAGFDPEMPLSHRTRTRMAFEQILQRPSEPSVDANSVVSEIPGILAQPDLQHIRHYNGLSGRLDFMSEGVLAGDTFLGRVLDVRGARTVCVEHVWTRGASDLSPNLGGTPLLPIGRAEWCEP